MNEADMTGERTIILHYHLFKNAGTSVDAILKRNFGDRWVTREFGEAGSNNTAQVEAWISETPEAVAYSSHTMLGPIPQVAGVRVISLVLLRDPIARIKSAYRFERAQKADTWGARLAKEHDFEGYVRARLERPADRQCRNFQTYRLALFAPGPGAELDRATAALDLLSVVGRVEAFDLAMERLRGLTGDAFPAFQAPATRANVSEETSGESGAEAVMELLEAENRADQDLLAQHGQHRHGMMTP